MKTYLKAHGAHPTDFEVGLDAAATAKGQQLHFYRLKTGEVLELITEPEPDGKVVRSMAISTYAPKSWESKIDPERDKFFKSFKSINEISLR